MSDSAAVLREIVGGWRRPLIAAGFVLAAFSVAPIAVVVPSSVTNSPFLSFPPKGFTTRWFEELVRSDVWRYALIYSSRLALLGALLATVLGTCAALAMQRLKSGARLLRAVFLAPLVIPQIVYALGLFTIFRASGMSGRWWTVLLGQSVLAFPVVFVIVSAGLRETDPALVNAAASLGSSWPGIVWRVQLPLLKRSVGVAALFSAVIIFDEFLIALFLLPPGQLTVPVQIWRATHESVSPVISAASVLVMGVAVLTLCATVLIMRGSTASRSRQG
jgi:putative spermidine/putrescine transport system permease protein